MVVRWNILRICHSTGRHPTGDLGKRFTGHQTHPYLSV